jgi:hypothetical protein
MRGPLQRMNLAEMQRYVMQAGLTSRPKDPHFGATRTPKSRERTRWYARSAEKEH